MSHSDTPSSWASGVSIFAGAALLTIGILQVLEGISAIAKDEIFAVTENYVFAFDLTAWGWIHLVVGLLSAATGGAILAGRTWAYMAGIGFAVASAVVNFAWLPYQPFWAVVIVAFDFWVIWALAKVLGSDDG
ncbi:hypothetical protein E8D34_01145 [Nocardioides sp. GY 10113]|uniref:DUF7144 family membrane protein n=1 Tax=Nocardioides sp. GY 10113 TaxID=2569761 RepID=UPI0010A89028|nr:hypothetical protein [Nocardioides sp. GY 10113]TIC89138.1 hypothetical protein E8D34_01145 [Nocardioides sp. GY 10113]